MTTTSEPVSPERVSEPTAADLASGKAVTLLQRVIMPRPGDPLKVRSLYLDEPKAKRGKSTTRSSPETAAPEAWMIVPSALDR